MPGIASNDQLLWDYLEGKSQFTAEYLQLIITHTNPNKIQGALTPLSYALSQKNLVAARAMLKSPEYLVQTDQLEGLRKAMVIALNSDNNEIKKIGEEILEQYGLLCDDAFTLGDKRYTPLSYVIHFKRESFNTFFQKQKKSTHTKRLAVAQALALDEWSIADTILNQFRNETTQRIYSSGQPSPLSDPKNQYGIHYNFSSIKLLLDNGADATLLLFEAVKQGNQALVIFLISYGVNLAQIVSVDEKRRNMSISSYIVREKPDMVDAMLEGVKNAPSAILSDAAAAAINTHHIEHGKKILAVFFNHRNPVIDDSKDILLFLQFAIQENEPHWARQILNTNPDTSEFIRETDDTLFSYVIKHHPDWINSILLNELILQKQRILQNNHAPKPNLVFRKNMLFALRAALEVNNVDIFENILKLREGLSAEVVISLDASCSRKEFKKLLDLAMAHGNPRFKQLLLNYGAQINPRLKSAKTDPNSDPHRFEREVNAAFDAGHYSDHIELLKKRPPNYSLTGHLLNAVEIPNAQLHTALLRLALPNDLYSNLELLITKALSKKNTQFIHGLIDCGIDVNYVIDTPKGDTSVLGLLIQNEQFGVVNYILNRSNQWGRRSYWAVSAAITKNRLDIANIIMDICGPEITLLAPKNPKDPIHDAAYQAAIRKHFSLVLKLVERGANIDLAIILEYASADDFKHILAALKGDAILPAKTVEKAIRGHKNTAVGLLLTNPIVSLPLQNADTLLSLLSTAIQHENFDAALFILDKYKNKLRFNDKVLELFLICASGLKPGHEDVALQLLELRQFEVSLLGNSVMPIDLWTLEGKTATEIAAETGKHNLLHELIHQHNAHPHLVRSKEQPMALSLALQNRHFKAARTITTHAAHYINSKLPAVSYNHTELSHYELQTTPAVNADRVPPTSHTDSLKI